MITIIIVIIIIIIIIYIIITIIIILSNKGSATMSPYSTGQDHRSKTTYSLMRSYTG